MAILTLVVLLLSSSMLVQSQVLTVTAIEQANYTCQATLPGPPICAENPLAACQNQTAGLADIECVPSSSCCLQANTTCYTQQTTCQRPPCYYYNGQCTVNACWNPTTTTVPYQCPFGPCLVFGYERVQFTPCFRLTAYLLSPQGIVSTTSQDCQSSPVCLANFLKVYRVNETVGTIPTNPTLAPAFSAAIHIMPSLGLSALLAVLASLN